MSSLRQYEQLETRRRDGFYTAVVFLSVAGLLFLFALLLAGCTVTPKKVSATVASFDGGAQNSGFLGYTTNGGVLTPHAFERYNALSARYGTNFVPALTPAAGCAAFTNGTWLIDAQHEIYFKTMVRWRKEGR